MLKFNSVFWSSANIKKVASVFEKLGFDVSPSARYPQNLSVSFGNESIELVPSESGPTSNQIGIIPDQEGITGIELESDDIANDYKDYRKAKVDLEKPRSGSNHAEGAPLWYGFHLPDSMTPDLKAWIVMGSADYYKSLENKILPLKHPNTCFGIEALAVNSTLPDEFTTKWSSATGRPKSKFIWNEAGHKTEAGRLMLGGKFLDAVNGARMLTLKVTDLEFCKELCLKAGFKIQPCHSRDGFLVDMGSEGAGLTLRFVRTAWTKYIPPTRADIPFYRREDKFRPLGGADTSTLTAIGFEPHWES